MKKINIIRRNAALAALMIGQYVFFTSSAWPELQAMISSPGFSHLTQVVFWGYMFSMGLASWGIALACDTAKAYSQHRLWKQGRLTHY